MKQIWDYIHVAGAAVGGFFGWYLGELDGLIYVLITFVVVDYITGVLRAVVEKKLSSRIGARGIVKKVAIFLVVGIGHLIDFYLLESSGTPLRTAVIFFYVANEGISLLENAAFIGLPVPEKLKDTLAQLHNKNTKIKNESEDDSDG